MILRAEEAPGRVRLLVEDDGPGFPDGALAPAATRSVTTKPDGSGLGLFLVHNIVAASGGAVGLARSPRGGAVVWLDLERAA